MHSGNCNSSVKFVRRNDLTPYLRLYIAFQAIFSEKWGAITQLSKEFLISLTFVYMLKADLETFVSQRYEPVVFEISQKDIHLQTILSFRFIGNSSIPAISEMLKYHGISHNSVGFISNFLNKLGSLLDNTIVNSTDNLRFVVYASDEVFSNNIPILITVDPVSSAILRIDLVDKRDADSWKKHWQQIYKQGYLALYLVNDEGIAMEAARKKSMNDIARQSDTFHAIAHRLGKWVDILHRIVLKAISHEYECERLFINAKSEANMKKRIDNYEAACKNTPRVMDTYEAFKFLYNCIISQLPVFDKYGRLIDKDYAQSEIELALVLIRGLNIEKINKEVDTIENLLNDLFTYKIVTETVLNNIKTTYDYGKEILELFCLAWHYQKQWRKSKDNERVTHFKEKEKSVLELLKDYLKNDFNTVKFNIISELDNIVQSSALVETINSIVRAFLNTCRNHINQNMLNLIMFYHNHRIYRAGKRKGKSPIELLSGKRLEKHWIDMLLEIWESAEEKNKTSSIEPIVQKEIS